MLKIVNICENCFGTKYSYPDIGGPLGLLNTTAWVSANDPELAVYLIRSFSYLNPVTVQSLENVFVVATFAKNAVYVISPAPDSSSAPTTLVMTLLAWSSPRLQIY